MKNSIENKPILVIETSGSNCGISIYFSPEKFFEINLNEKYSHAEKLFKAIELLSLTAGVSYKDFSAVAVSSGPGSFTGLRIGMSAAKGIAFASSIPIIPVPTFEALALQITSYLIEDTEFVISNKINTNEVYYARFKVTDNNYIFTEDLKILNKEDLIEKSQNFITFGNVFNSSMKREITVPKPEYVAKWALLRGKKILDYDYLEPNYIKNFIVKERNHD